MSNPYSQLSERLVSVLQTDMTTLGWTPLETRKGIWKPGSLQPWERYLVYVAPPLQNPVTEVRDSRLVYYVLRADVFLLVKNFSEDEGLSVYGETLPDAGVFQMLFDAKTVLRATNLGGLVDRTYSETLGGSQFETGAATGFDTGTFGWVHRARIQYTAQTVPFCYP